MAQILNYASIFIIAALCIVVILVVFGRKKRPEMQLGEFKDKRQEELQEANELLQKEL